MEESICRVDSSVPLTHHDHMDRGGAILDLSLPLLTDLNLLLWRQKQREMVCFKAECFNICTVSFPLTLKIVLVTF